MSISPIITFKAGRCDLDSSTTPPRVRSLPEPGYIYLYSEDDLLHFCWRERFVPLDTPDLDLVMIPTDGSFTPYGSVNPQGPANSSKPSNGRIYVLKFTSSSQRHLFWLQSRSQHDSADPSWFSSRDLKLGQIVNTLLQGEDIDVQQEIANIPDDRDGTDKDEDDDATMEDVDGQNDIGGASSGGAGAGATGGDIREEGHEAREGGADGGRASTTNTSSRETSTIVQDFLKSVGGISAGQSSSQTNDFTSLVDLLTPASTSPLVDSLDAASVDRYLEYLPPNLLSLARETKIATALRDGHPMNEEADADVQIDEKKALLHRVLRSPQFSQSLSSLTTALRDGGLPMISEALRIPVQNGGFLRRGGVPLGGGNAVEAFINGVKDHVDQRNSRT